MRSGDGSPNESHFGLQEVEALVELVHRRIGVQLRPQSLRHLLAMETMAGGQGDDLQKALGPAPLPGLVEDDARAGSQGELAQELEVCQSRHDDKRTPGPLVHDARASWLFVRARSPPGAPCQPAAERAAGRSSKHPASGAPDDRPARGDDAVIGRGRKGGPGLLDVWARVP